MAIDDHSSKLELLVMNLRDNIATALRDLAEGGTARFIVEGHKIVRQDSFRA
ncbi:hypothetical protein GCM10025859_11710 [Alicyclobacillus fastidiosus]|nr:hypothetical protein GCM10025859_11710 [Alicyclobacillus fastidiosus]